MTEKDPNITSRRAPYIAASIGIGFSILLWAFLMYEHLPSYILHSFIVSFPWIVSIASVLVSIVIAIGIRLVQLTRERTRAYQMINETVKKEIAKRIKSEESKQKLERALLQGQKLQAMGTLAGGIAHDFNNLLYAIMGYVEMAREDVPKESIIYKNLGKVLEASVRGQELVARILAFSRRQHHEFKPISLKMTIENALSLIKPTIPASADIRISINNDCTVFGDQTQLHQILVNIITNAVDAMEGEGTIDIQLDSISKEDDFLKQLPQIAKQDYCRLIVKDTGHGMDPSTIERIFEPFFTTKEVGKGTGLGLSTVHAIVKEHHGEIFVDSQLGHGATFTILLPEHQNGE